MKFPRRSKTVVRLGWTLLVAAIIGLAYYLSTAKIEVHLTSRLFGLIFFAVILVLFVVVPMYSIVITREIRKRRRMEVALVRAKEEAESASKFKDRFLS